MSKLKAGALQYTLVISFVIILLIGFAIFSYYLNGILIDGVVIQNQLKSDVNSAISISMADFDGFIDNKKIVEIDFDDSTSKVNVQKKSWGLYSIITATCQRGIFTTSKSVLVGHDIIKTGMPAIYLKDNRRYLTVTGNNIIKGNCFLPLQGVTGGRFGGVGFLGSKPIEGNIDTALFMLPQLQLDNLTAIYNLQQNPQNSDSIINYYDVGSDGFVSNLFSSNTLYLHSRLPIHVNNTSISGNVIVKSDTLITIDQSAIVKDAIFVAPYIVVNEGFKGNLQLIAEKGIIINENCLLQFPSSVVVNDTLWNVNDNHAIIKIENNSVVCGAVVLIVKNRILDNSRVIIENDAVVFGQIYSNNLVEHKGTVYGSIYCDRFFRILGSSMFYNILHYSVTDITQLPNEYLGISFSDNENFDVDIIKYLD